jgi:hypothetical protein
MERFLGPRLGATSTDSSTPQRSAQCGPTELTVNPVHVMTRKFLGEMTRMLSVTCPLSSSGLRGITLGL